MTADYFRTLYDYHFALNRRLWDESIMTLTDEQFIRPLDYSIGSIRNQTVHMMSVDQRWFARLGRVDPPERLNYDDFPDQKAVRDYWDNVEAGMRGYLSALTDDGITQVLSFPTQRRGISSSPAWQILLHVVNHGTDHRAQLLAMLYAMGAPTLEQDFILYLWSLEDA